MFGPGFKTILTGKENIEILACHFFGIFFISFQKMKTQRAGVITGLTCPQKQRKVQCSLSIYKSYIEVYNQKKRLSVNGVASGAGG